MTNKKLIISWLDAVEGLIKERVTTGTGFPGYKLVAGRSNRRWADEVEAEKVLVKLLKKKGAYGVPKLLTVTQAEKALGKKKEVIKDLIVKPEGAPALVPDSDKRKPLQISADDFDAE